MFNLKFIEFNAGLVCYWHNGFYHFLDSKNTLLKIEAPKKSSKKFSFNCSVKSESIFLNRAVGKAIFYPNVFLANPQFSPSLFVAKIENKEGKELGSIEISGLNRRQRIQCYYSDIEDFWDTLDFEILPLKKSYENVLDDFKLIERKGSILTFKSERTNETVTIRCFSRADVEEYSKILKKIVEGKYDDEATT